MKLAPAERYGNWRPGGSDARVAAVSRLQTVTPETAGQSAAPALSSGRELPVLAVQRGSLAQARPVLQSDKPQNGVVAPALTQAAQSSTGSSVLVTSTVDAFPPQAAQVTPGKVTPGAKTTTSSDAKPDAKVGDGLASADTALARPPKVTVASIAAAQAADAARHLAAEKASNEPPKEPLSKMLLDLVQSVWAASGSVVDAASSSSKARSTVTSKQGAVAAATYTANAVKPSAQSSTN